MNTPRPAGTVRGNFDTTSPGGYHGDADLPDDDQDDDHDTYCGINRGRRCDCDSED